MSLGEFINATLKDVADGISKTPNGQLNMLLAEASEGDLAVLVDYITDKGKGRLMLDSTICARLNACKAANIYTKEDRHLIGKEIRAFGGNTLVNIARGDGVDYGDLVRDVANRLKVPFNKQAKLEVIEIGILQRIFSDALDQMTEEQRKNILEEMGLGELVGLTPAAIAAAIAAGRIGGFATYKMAIVVANAISKALLGRGLPFVAGPIIGKALNLALGPIGWVITGLWTAADLASPAYRVTVPAVVQIAYIRQLSTANKSSKECTSCRRRNDLRAKFCSDCGAMFPAVA